MNQKHVTSLELSKRLKELGCPQESMFWWYESKSGKDNFCLYSESASEQAFSIDLVNTGRLKGVYSAYLSSELGDILPAKLDKKARATDYYCDYDLSIDKRSGDNYWEISYCGGGDAGCVAITFSETEADARAKMIIYLAEQGLIKL